MPDVAVSPRQRILEATILVVGRRGYRDATVAEVIAEAGIAPIAFHQHFEGKHDCFLAAYDLVIERVFATVDDNCDRRKNWLERVHNGLEAIVELFALEPELARTAVVEVAAAGIDARRRHWTAIARFTEYLVEGHALARAKPLPSSISLMAAGAVSGLIFEELLTNPQAKLPALLPDLLFALLVPYIGPREAAAEMRRASTR